MRFLPLKICEQALKIGLKSHSEHAYDSSGELTPYYVAQLMTDDDGFYVGAFGLEDFVGTHNTAKDNCQLLDISRLAIICSGDWVKYVSSIIESYAKK